MPGALRGRRGDAASRVLINLCAGFLLDLLLDLRPGIFQRYGAVENEMPGPGIRVHAKIPEAFELVAAFDRRVRQRWLQLGLGDHFQRVRIQVRGEFLAFFNLIRVFLGEEFS